MRVPVIAILLLGNAFHQLSAQTVNDSVFSAAVIQSSKLLGIGNTKINNLPQLKGAKPLLLLAFLSPECPICNNYMPVLNELEKQFAGSVQFAGIVPGRTYSADTVKAFSIKHKLGFPVYIDSQKKLTNYLHASITPEVILLNEKYELVYKGAIDNRVKQLGIKRWQATAFYLSDAITKYLQHTSIAIKRVKATGCLINDF